MKETGRLYVIAAPSGAGKTTLVKSLVQTVPKLSVSISHTTRAKRPNEEDGINYHFVSKEEFNDMIAAGDLLEYAGIFDHLYGTSKEWVIQTLARGIDIILEIDWQGQRQIKTLFSDIISIFIFPPSYETLKHRLTHRNQDAPEIIEKRLLDVKETISHASEFDYWVINDDFDVALNDLKMIIQSGRLLSGRQAKRHAELFETLSMVETS